MQALSSLFTFKNLLKFSVFTVFFGRAYQYFFWDVPFRAVLWDEYLMKPVVEFFNGSWGNFVRSSQLDWGIHIVTTLFGILFLCCAFLIWRYNGKNNCAKFVLFTGAIGLIILAFLLLKSQFYRIGQFFEYSIQIGIPFIAIYYHKQFIKTNLIFILKMLIACTFIAHGLYAVGYYPVPGHFLAMVIDFFGFDEPSSRLFLTIAGYLDFFVAIGLFIPRMTKLALVYATVWGTMTAMARIMAGFDFTFFWELLHLNMYQVIYRLAHGLIPLALLLKLQESQKR